MSLLPTHFTHSRIETHLFITNQFNQSSPTNYIMMNAPSISVHTLRRRSIFDGYHLRSRTLQALEKTNKRPPVGRLPINIMIIIIISSKLWKPLISVQGCVGECVGSERGNRPAWYLTTRIQIFDLNY